MSRRTLKQATADLATASRTAVIAEIMGFADSLKALPDEFRAAEARLRAERAPLVAFIGLLAGWSVAMEEPETGDFFFALAHALHRHDVTWAQWDAALAGEWP